MSDDTPKAPSQDTAPPRKRRWALWAVVFVLLAAAAAGIIVGHWNHYIRAPISALDAERTVVVEEGQSWPQVIETLSKDGVVVWPLHFKALVRVRRMDQRLRPGRYILPPGITPEGVLARLTRSGPDGSYRLTVPEGFSMYRIADRVEAEGLASRAAFLKAATDKVLMKRLKVRGESFEGYLFPDTYFLPPGATPQVIITRMVKRHRQVWKKVLKDVGAKKVAALRKAHGLADPELITLASIVEKEAVVADERPIIARVFYNRLKKDMKLQTDPTCVYGPKIYTKKPSPKLCRDAKSRYSTYVIKGLPPGPIANPGRASMMSVLKPTTDKDKVDYLYFVARRGGRRHTFSKTYEAHKKAIPR